MAIGITIDVRGARAKMRKLKNQITAQQVLASIGNADLAWINEQFKTEGALGGRRWEPLSERTLAARRLAGRGAKILRDTGRLAMSFVRGQGDNIFRVRNISVTVGTQTDYAADHEEGKGLLPVRRMLPTTLQAKQIAKRELNAIYRKAAR